MQFYCHFWANQMLYRPDANLYMYNRDLPRIRKKEECSENIKITETFCFQMYLYA